MTSPPPARSISDHAPTCARSVRHVELAPPVWRLSSRGAPVHGVSSYQLCCALASPVPSLPPPPLPLAPCDCRIASHTRLAEGTQLPLPRAGLAPAGAPERAPPPRGAAPRHTLARSMRAAAQHAGRTAALLPRDERDAGAGAGAARRDAGQNASDSRAPSPRCSPMDEVIKLALTTHRLTVLVERCFHYQDYRLIIIRSRTGTWYSTWYLVHAFWFSLI